MDNNTKKKIYLATPHMSQEGYEQQYVKEAFDTNWLSSVGANLNGLEAEFVQTLKSLDTSDDTPSMAQNMASVALSSGTAAMHLAIKSLGIKAGDEVLCQSLTFSATVNPVVYENATPVFIDSEEDTWNMSPVALQNALRACKHVKAVILVHLYGIPAKIDEIRSLCNEYKVPLIEDAAESLGSTYHGVPTGTFGDLGIISFNGNKIITTSGGGMLLINGVNNLDAAVVLEKAAKIRFWSTQARDNARHYQHSEIGYNYRMSNVIAGIGRGQLKVLNQRIMEKQAIFQYYKEHLKGIPGISWMPIPQNTNCNCWLSCMVLDPKCSTKPLDIIEALEKDNIESRPIWKPMHMQPIFADCQYFDNGGISQSLFENGLCLPSSTNMSAEDMERIVHIIKSCFAHLG